MMMIIALKMLTHRHTNIHSYTYTRMHVEECMHYVSMSVHSCVCVCIREKNILFVKTQALLYKLPTKAGKKILKLQQF